jgi:hypothetical protein
MSDEEEGHGVLLQDGKDRSVSGYLKIGNKQYWITGERITSMRTHLHVTKTPTDDKQEDLFDEHTSQSGERKRDLV